MKPTPRYRRHTSVGPKLIGLFRVAFCVGAVGLCVAKLVQGLREGQVEAPIRASHLVVTDTSPAWFAVVLLAYGFMAVVFAFGTYFFGKQLIEDFRT